MANVVSLLFQGADSPPVRPRWRPPDGRSFRLCLWPEDYLLVCWSFGVRFASPVFAWNDHGRTRFHPLAAGDIARISVASLNFQRRFEENMRRTLEWNPIAWLQQYSWRARLIKMGTLPRLRRADVHGFGGRELLAESSTANLSSSPFWPPPILTRESTDSSRKRRPARWN